MSKSPKNLVIDASIARSVGGEEATYPTSVNCRNFLQTVLDRGHKMVFTLEIKKEWDRHQSKFADRWRRTMLARKRLVYIKDPSDRQELWNIIESTIEADNDDEFHNKKEAMFKDFHLLEAALETDKTIAALDERVRKLFAIASKQAKEIREIVWVNPDRIEEEQPIAWLENGAEFDSDRTLDIGEV
ncbi:MAG: hypothetical protein AAGA60_19730 [Cyanobacteria bacterium P01_E01_bin.42]